MRCDNNQNLWEYNGGFDHYHDHQLVNNHHHQSLSVSGSTKFEGSSNNGGIISGFDQTSDQQTASNNLNLHPQGGSPIGLSLRKSTSLINLVEMTLSQERQQKKVEACSSQPTPEKLKASNFPATILQIGFWKRISRNEGDLVAKLYYAKKKLVWEFLDGPLKSKIEIQWSEISAIRAFMYKGEHGLLEIELNQPPQYGREINPQPRKHTQWKQATDFTQGQASICRRHSVIFPPGVLDKQYEKLLQCDNRLFNLSQQPFPVNNYPFFYHDPYACLDYSNMNAHHRPPGHFIGDFDPNLPMSVTRFPYSGEGTIRHTNENHESGNSEFEGIPGNPIGVQNDFLPNYGQESWTSVQQSQTKTLLEEIDSVGYANDGISSIDRLRVNSETGIQEPTSWIGVSYPWDHTITEDLGGLYGNQHNNPNWT